MSTAPTRPSRAAPTVAWSMHAGARSTTPRSHVITGHRPTSPVWRMIQSDAVSTCLSTYGWPSITTRSNRVPDFESALSIGTRDDAPATSSSIDAATG